MTQHDPDHPVIHIRDIDLNSNTVQFTVDGISVTAVCSSQDDSEIFDNVKQILIGRYIKTRRTRKKTLDKIGQISAKVR